MALYEDVNQAAQAAIQQQGHTVGDALGAYSAVTKLQQGKQELELKKQENERNKAQWLNSQIVAIGRQPEGAARDLMIKGFGQQLPNIVPGANPDIPELFKRDPEMLRKATEAAVHYSQGGAFDPNALNQWFTMNTPEAVEALNKNAENVAKIKSAQFAAQSGRNQAASDNAVMSASNHIHTDPTIVKGVARGQAFDTDLDQLSRKPNWQTYNEVFQNYANSLAGAKGVISDAKLHEMQTALHGPVTGKWATFATDNPGAAGNEASPEAVRWLQTKLSEINTINDRQMGTAALRRASIAAKYFRNPAISASMQDTAKMYLNGNWRQINPSYAGPGAMAEVPSQAAAAPQAQNSTPYGTTPKEIEANYQAYLAQKAHQQAGKGSP